MTVSFDLDDLLIPGVKTFQTEEKTPLQRLLRIESIRKGTVELFKELKRQGHSIYIYTTSFRSTLRIKLTFYSYGIPVRKIINQTLHNKVMREQSKRTSKYPPAFNIDVHIDDSFGLKIEGDRYNFATIIIKEDDDGWQKTVLERLQSYSRHRI